MKKYILFIFTIVISAFFLISLIGCNMGEDANDENPEFVFVPDFSSLSTLIGHLPNINNITITNGYIYFTSTSNITSTSLFRETQIFKIELDEADQSKLSNIIHLSNYTTLQPMIEADGGGSFINALQIDEDGSIWIAETNKYVTFDFPSGFNINDANEDEIWEHHIPLGTSYLIHRLDITGTKTKTLNVSDTIGGIQGWVGLSSFFVDGKDNIFIGSGQSIYVLDSDGQVQFNLNAENFIQSNSLIRLADGRVALSTWNDKSSRMILNVVDIQKKAWGETIESPINTFRIYHGFNDFLFVYNDGKSLSAIDHESGDVIQIINWTVSGVEPSSVDNIFFLSDDRILLTTSSEDVGIGQLSVRSELIILYKTPHDEIIEKIELTIASTMPHILSAAVTEFNRTNYSYSIEIIEIEWDGTLNGINRLLLEIIAGRGPDLIHTQSFPFHQWAGQGLFTDLYELIDTDPLLSRADFVKSILNSTELDGKLYQMYPDFWVDTIFGHPDVVGSNLGWTIDEFMNVLNANPQATIPFGEWIDGRNLLEMIIKNNFESFVDWSTGTVHFDNDYFVDLLEFVFDLDKRISIDLLSLIMRGQSQTPQLISSGEQLMIISTFAGFEYYSVFQDIFNGEFVFKGYPAEDWSGNSINSNLGIAITSISKNQQGAWEFLRMLLSEKYQRQNAINAFPTNKNIFNERITKTMEEVTLPAVLYEGLLVIPRPLSQEDVNDIVDLIDSISKMTSQADPLWNIINETVSDFYSGAITSKNAARIIQNRASNYVAELS